MSYLEYGLLQTTYSRKLVYSLKRDTTEPMPTATCSLQMTCQQNRKTIDNSPRNLTNNAMTEITLTIHGSKPTNH